MIEDNFYSRGGGVNGFIKSILRYLLGDDPIGVLEWLMDQELEKDAAEIDTDYIDVLALLLLKCTRLYES